ncbi:MAG: beta-ketoacyl-[acyl-carrier-protein] synthase family protein, partial [Desulfuromonadaceae bacterium]
MRAVCVVDTALVTAFGDGPVALWRGLSAGQSAIAPLRRFDSGRYQSRLAACVPDLKADGDDSLLLPLLERLLRQLQPVPADSR